jgi:hypothetical protein
MNGPKDNGAPSVVLLSSFASCTVSFSHGSSNNSRRALDVKSLLLLLLLLLVAGCTKRAFMFAHYSHTHMNMEQKERLFLFIESEVSELCNCHSVFYQLTFQYAAFEWVVELID